MAGLPPLLVLAAAVVALALLVRPAAVRPTTTRLRAVQQETRRWRLRGLVLGVALAGLSLLLGGPLGRGALLAAPLLAVGVLAGVLVGELRVTAPADGQRRAALEVRRVRDYAPRVLSWAVVGTVVALLALLAVTTAVGSTDDMGRAGRWLTRACSPVESASKGPWPGAFYALPLLAVVLPALGAAGLALRRVVQRPRQGEDPAVDDALRGQAATAVVAAVGLLTAIPLAGTALTAGAGLLGHACAQGWWAPAGAALLLAVPLLLLLAAGCGAVLVRPHDGRRARADRDDAAAAAR